MPLHLAFALAAPLAFVHAIETRLAKDHMHVVDWWADDLDGDKVAESIAFVCNDDAGVYLVQHGKDLLEAPAQIDGRNNCPPAAKSAPAWHIAKTGVIIEGQSVHHGHIEYSLAIREGRLALVRMSSDGIDVGRDGTTDETSGLDYEALTWSESAKPPKGGPTHAEGALVLITDKVRRATKLVGASTIAATRSGNATLLHVHADQPLVIRDCNEKPCKSTSIAKGDRDLGADNPFNTEILAGKVKIVLRFENVDGAFSYPDPPK